MWSRFLSQRLEAVVYHYTRQYSALLHASRRVLCISWIVEATLRCMICSLHPTLLLRVYCAPLSCPSVILARLANRSSATHNSLTSSISDYLLRTLYKLVKFWTLRPHFDVYRRPPTNFCPHNTHCLCIWTQSNALNSTHVDLLVNRCDINLSVFWLHLWAMLLDWLCFTIVAPDHAKSISRSFREKGHTYIYIQPESLR